LNGFRGSACGVDAKTQQARITIILLSPETSVNHRFRLVIYNLFAQNHETTTDESISKDEIALKIAASPRRIARLMQTACFGSINSGPDRA